VRCLFCRDWAAACDLQQDHQSPQQ
jgi:hypothetical protein